MGSSHSSEQINTPPQPRDTIRYAHTMVDGMLPRLRYISDDGGKTFYKIGEVNPNFIANGTVSTSDSEIGSIDLGSDQGNFLSGDMIRKTSRGLGGIPAFSNQSREEIVDETKIKRINSARSIASAASGSTMSTASVTGSDSSSEDNYLETGGPKNLVGLSNSPGTSQESAPSESNSITSSTPTTASTTTFPTPNTNMSLDLSSFPELQANPEDIALEQRIRASEERQMALLEQERLLEQRTAEEVKKIEDRVKQLKSRLNIENTQMHLRDRRDHPCSAEENLVLNCLRRHRSDMLRCGRYVDEFNLCAARAGAM